jgi:hypothetical protein
VKVFVELTERAATAGREDLRETVTRLVDGRDRRQRADHPMAEVLLERAEAYGLERIFLKEGGGDPYAPDPVRFCREVLPLL